MQDVNSCPLRLEDPTIDSMWPMVALSCMTQLVQLHMIPTAESLCHSCKV